MKREDITDDLVADPFYSESNISYLEQKMDEYKKGELKFEKHEIDCSDECIDETVKTEKILNDDPDYTKLLPDEKENIEGALLDFENGVNIEDESGINW